MLVHMHTYKYTQHTHNTHTQTHTTQMRTHTHHTHTHTHTYTHKGTHTTHTHTHAHTQHTHTHKKAHTTHTHTYICAMFQYTGLTLHTVAAQVYIGLFLVVPLILNLIFSWHSNPLDAFLVRYSSETTLLADLRHPIVLHTTHSKEGKGEFSPRLCNNRLAKNRGWCTHKTRHPTAASGLPNPLSSSLQTTVVFIFLPAFLLTLLDSQGIFFWIGEDWWVCPCVGSTGS